MDQTEQATRLQKIVDTLAMQAMERPLNERHAFLEEETAALKRDASQAYAGDQGKIDAAAVYFDKVEEFAKAMVGILEKSGDRTGNA